MILRELWRLYQQEIFERPSQPALFNPYRDADPSLDVRAAAEIRRSNLRAYLAAFPERPDTIVIGEAPGPRGGRFTGVPYTSERLYACDGLPFRGRKTSLRDESCAESTATIFWNVMRPHFPRFVIWNTVPYHPHRVGEALSIRTPAASEVDACLDLMAEAMRIIEPNCILAVGRIAQHALNKLNHDFIPIRHPSHGGATEFERGMQNTFTLINGSVKCIPSS
jgi:hypothetical protein